MGETFIERAKRVLADEAEAIKSCIQQINNSIEDIADLILSCSGHVLVTGAGTSRAVAQRLAHLMACCGTPALFINAADCLHGGAGAITDKDIVYIISKGGRSKEINNFAAIAKKRGAKIIAQTEKPESPLGEMSDLIFNIIAPPDVDPFGMIATGSSLVNSAAADALCILLLEKRGYTKKEFVFTHPEGAVGVQLTQEKRG
jgi:D-arabinose 5-phosphate isomerase GutQ